jgi:uncharacterized membrane protein YccC
VREPLAKPDHLHAPVTTPEWLARHALGLLALALGTIAFVVVAVSQDHLWSTPDWRLSTPGFVVTALAAAGSLARRERAVPLWLAGLGLAAAALVLGWFMMLTIVIGATVVLIVLLHSVM